VTEFLFENDISLLFFLDIIFKRCGILFTMGNQRRRPEGALHEYTAVFVEKKEIR